MVRFGRLRYRLCSLLLAAGVCACPAAAQSPRLHLTFLGDLMGHTVNYLIPDYSSIYEAVSPYLERDDLSFANLEFPVHPARPFSSYPCFNGTDEYLKAAVQAGIEVFSLANNHAFDQGLEGIVQTLGSLDRIGRAVYRRLYANGTRSDISQPFRPQEIRVDGVRIGFLAVCQMVNQPLPQPYVHIVDFENQRHRRYFLQQAAQIAPRYDLFILSYHGGREYGREPEQQKMSFFAELLEVGVDIVWAHHPHVVQPYRLVERAEGRGLILYSTGNFISGMARGLDPRLPEHDLAWTVDSALWLVAVEREERGLSVAAVLPLPIANYPGGRGQILVDTYPALARRDLSEDWLRFYRRRAGLLPASLAPLSSGGPAARRPPVVLAPLPPLQRTAENEYDRLIGFGL